jgi:orotate phosphoribosyltransferase
MNANILPQIDAGLRRIVALQLWELGAVRVNTEDPFRLVSGNYSPIYINCRQLISSLIFVDILAAAARIICDVGAVNVDVIAGGETAGIPFAAFLARTFNRPMIYVRKQAKAHGIATPIEGVLSPGQKVLLVEDLITDAGSKLAFIESIRHGGAFVEDVFVVFDRLQGGREALQEKGIRLHAATDMKMVLEVAREAGVLAEETLTAVHEYLVSPASWHSQRNFPYHK